MTTIVHMANQWSRFLCLIQIVCTALLLTYLYTFVQPMWYLMQSVDSWCFHYSHCVKFFNLRLNLHITELESYMPAQFEVTLVS